MRDQSLEIESIAFLVPSNPIHSESAIACASSGCTLFINLGICFQSMFKALLKIHNGGTSPILCLSAGLEKLEKKATRENKVRLMASVNFWPKVVEPIIRKSDVYICAKSVPIYL